MPAKKNIFIFGDSITYGEWDSSGGWANRLREYYDSLQPALPADFVITYNLGIPSDTSAGVAQRLTQETQARLTPNPSEKEIQFLIAIGTNDTRWSLDGKKYEIEAEAYRENLEKIVSAASAFSDDIVFVGLLPIIDADVMRTGKRHGWDVNYDNESVRRYNDVLKQFCAQSGYKYIDVFTPFEKLIEDATNPPLFSDGLHPNDYGHSVIYNEVHQFLMS